MTRRFVALAVAGLAALAALVDASPAPSIAPADAPEWEGQAVAVHGVARGVRPGDPDSRFDVVLAGHAIPVRTEAEAPAEGSPVEARGRLVRVGGTLTLLADRVTPTSLDPDAAVAVALAALAEDPASWVDRVALVNGTVERGRLVAEGHGVSLGAGEWPKDGPVSAAVLLSYDAACACHRLDRVQPWTR